MGKPVSATLTALAAELGALPPGARVDFGWGQASSVTDPRHGYWLVYPSNLCIYLGKSRAEAEVAVREMAESRRRVDRMQADRRERNTRDRNRWRTN